MLTWGSLTTMIDNAKRGLDFNEALFFAFSQKGVQEFVIELNTDGQLWVGIDSTGKELSSIGGDYSPITIQDKKFKSLPFDRVTLFDEGDFYRSFKVKPDRQGITIEADTVSKYDEDLRNRWGKDIIGLTDESISELSQEIAPEIIRYILNTLLR